MIPKSQERKQGFTLSLLHRHHYVVLSYDSRALSQEEPLIAGLLFTKATNSFEEGFASWAYSKLFVVLAL